MFTELGDDRKKQLSNDLIHEINEFIQEECPELSFNQLVGYLLFRENRQSERDIASVGHNLFTGTIKQNHALN